jgi:outer membrane lipoprotein-sorting protein
MTETLDATPRPRSGRVWLRWTVPLAVAAAAVGIGTAGRWLPASADQALPGRSPQQLLEDLQTARLDTLSGTVVQRSDLGLPALPVPSGRGSSELSSLVTGTHTLRVWYDGQTRTRLALLGTLGESDVIRNGRDLWVWSSEQKTAKHIRLPADAATPDPTPSSPAVTPQQAAKMALDKLDPSTVITSPGATTVAGRDANQLVLAPKDTGSLVGQVRIAIDAEQHFPLRVQVYAAKAQDPAFEVGFTQVSLDRPDAGQFRFSPPPGTKVDEQALPKGSTQEKAREKALEKAGAAADRPQVVGTGWTSVVVARGAMAGDLTGSGSSFGSSWPRCRR